MAIILHIFFMKLLYSYEIIAILIFGLLFWKDRDMVNL